METPLFITTEEAANVLNVNIRHIKNMILAGKLRAKNVSAGNKRKVWRVYREDVYNLQTPMEVSTQEKEWGLCKK